MKKIPLSGFRGKGLFTLVDDKDYEEFNKWKWKLDKSGCATRSKYKNSLYRLHREIMNCSKGMVVDHINGDRLDNRRENLRICTYQQNSFNSKKHYGSTSKYKGVSYKKDHKRWMACIYLNRKFKHIGYYNTEDEAAMAWNKVAKQYHGEFAKLNDVRSSSEA